MPRPTTISNRLLDLSHHQANVDFDAIKADGVEAVFLKATTGATGKDPAFAARLPQAIAAGLKVGAYHFGTDAPSQDQVNNFIAAVTAAAPSGFVGVVPALDVEKNGDDPDNSMSADQAEEWVHLFRDSTGIVPMIYAGEYLRSANGAVGRPNMGACPLWVASYTDDPAVLPGWDVWTIWQYPDGPSGPWPNRMPGVSGDGCDQDGYNATAELSFDLFWLAHSATVGA